VDGIDAQPGSISESPFLTANLGHIWGRRRLEQAYGGWAETVILGLTRPDDSSARVQIPISPPYIEKPLNRKIQGLFVFRSGLCPGEHRGISALEFDPSAPGNSGAFEQHIGDGCECDTDRNDQNSRQQV